MLPNFEINGPGAVSRAFIANGITTFSDVCRFVKQLSYGRNKDKSDVVAVLADACGTCSTKHALLKLLADENGHDEVRLKAGIFRMNERNTPAIADVLARYQLEYIPEVHNYLEFEGERFDFTSRASRPSDFEDDLLEEMDMLPSQIGDYKVKLHKNYILHWLMDNNDLNLSPDKLWAIREACIAGLSNKRNTDN